MKNWTILQWRPVLFSDESPFVLLLVPNRQNGRVYACSSREVSVIEMVKNQLKIMVWGMMSYRGLSELHFTPRGHCDGRQGDAIPISVMCQLFQLIFI